MKGNKHRFQIRTLLVAAVLCLFSITGFALYPVLAEPSAGVSGPAMFGIKEIVIKTPRFGDKKTAKNCGLSQQAVSDALRKALQQNGIPAVTEDEAPPANIGIARLYLVPEVYSYNSQTLDCVSWLSLWAESHNHLRVPPVDMMRNVTIVYWHEGILIEGDQSSHDSQVTENMKKLAGLFAEQFKLDQPPPSPYQ